MACTLGVGTLPAQGRPGRVRGVVVDSLLGDVLPGATVRLLPLGRHAVSDSTGRFVFDSVPAGDWSVSFTHPALDSIGITGSAQPVHVFAGASAMTIIGTPAFEPIRQRFCGETRDSLSPSVAFGTVQTRDGARVRVNVSVSWMLGSVQGASASPGTVRTIADGAQQLWIACGIPLGAWFHASVQDSLRNASAFMHMGPRGIAVQNLVLGSGTAPVQGVVRDAAGVPVRGARVSVEGTTQSAESDARGAFFVRDAPNGTVTVDVRAAGFAPWVAAVNGGDTLDVELQPLRLSPSLSGRGSDYLRLLQRSGREGVQLLTGAALSGDSAALSTLPLAGTCAWWLDGRPVSREFFLAQPQWSWRALELYPRGEEAPPEYRQTGCPIALLWTAAADW